MSINKETAITDNNSAPVYDSVTNNIVVAALYKFTRFADFEQYREPILNTMLDNDVKGTLLLASEGINGTISGTRQAIDTVLDYLRSIEAIGTFTFKESYTDTQPFYRTKVKLKKRNRHYGCREYRSIGIRWSLCKTKRVECVDLRS
nr:hypothetical protein [Psychrobacter sp. JCM 18900]